MGVGLGSRVTCEADLRTVLRALHVAMAVGVKLPELASIVHAYPSYSIAIQQMAAEVYYKQLDKSMPLYNLLKRIGL